MRLIDADALKNLPFERMIHTDFGDTAIPIEEIDNAPTVEPCYQTGSCLDCKMYDKENYYCPRFCEVIRQIAEENQRPQGECEKCTYRIFAEGFVDSISEVMAQNGITSVEELQERLRAELGGES